MLRIEFKQPDMAMAWLETIHKPLSQLMGFKCCEWASGDLTEVMFACHWQENHRCRMKKHVERVQRSIKLCNFHTIQHKPSFPNNLTLQFKTPDRRSIATFWMQATTAWKDEIKIFELSPAGKLVRAMAWDEFGNDAPGRSVRTAKGSFVGQRLDSYGWKVRGRNVMSKEWLYSLPSNIYFQALQRFRSLPPNCHHLHQTFLLPITPFQPFSSVYQTSATK